MKKIIISFLLISCGAGISDFTEDLGSNYTLESESKELTFIYKKPNMKPIKVLPTVLSYNYNRDFIVAKQHPCKEGIILYEINGLIEDKIDIYKTFKDSIKSPARFTIEDSLLVIKIKNQGYNGIRNSIKDQEIISKESDSIITNDPFYRKLFIHEYNYWIVDKKQDYIYGPLTKMRYNELKDSLGIHLELRTLSDF